MSLLPEKWDGPEAGLEAIFGIAGLFLAKDFFFVEETKDDDGDEEGKNR